MTMTMTHAGIWTRRYGRFSCRPSPTTVDNGGLAQMERLLQFGRVLSRSV
jgi:hypothetical protein